MTDPRGSHQTPDVNATLAPHALADGTPPVLADVYRAHFGYVWHALRRLGVRTADLEDAAQEVFLVVHRKLAEFDATRPMRPWLFGILHRVASDNRRRAYNKREIQTDDIRSTDPRGGPEHAAQTRQDQDLVLRALDTMDFDKRTVLVMHEFHDHPVPEIADALGIPLNTAYSRLRLARADFAASVRRLRDPRGAP